MLHIAAIILNALVIAFYSFIMIDGILDEFRLGAPKIKFFFNITFVELFVTSLFMLVLPILNIKFIYTSR